MKITYVYMYMYIYFIFVDSTYIIKFEIRLKVGIINVQKKIAVIFNTYINIK